ncbi:MAG: WG repeat-containing protein [Eubacteriales bacterium]|nr:WG repeat-containing protein [Eubacteriales bacterium]
MRGAGYARFSPSNPTSTQDDEYNEGIINRDGEIVVDPQYIIDEGYDGYYYDGKDTGVCVVMNEAGLFGFFNVVNGYFSGAIYEAIANMPSEGLTQVLTQDAHGESRVGYVDAITGEMVIAPQYDMDVYNGRFTNGYAIVKQKDESAGSLKTYLIDRKGNQLSMPEGYEPSADSYVSENRIAVVNLMTGLYGYADLNGNLVIDSLYTEAEPFDQRVAMVMRGEDTGWEYIDAKGQSAPEPPEKSYPLNGTSLDLVFNDEGDMTAQVVDEQDNVLIPFSEGYLFNLDYSFGSNNYFNEGFQALYKDDRFGFIDEKGQIAIPFIYDEASNFSNGLAQVTVDHRMMYIDYQGNVVWQEP